MLPVQVGQRLVTAPLLLVPGIGLAAWLYANAKSEGLPFPVPPQVLQDLESNSRQSPRGYVKHVLF